MAIEKSAYICGPLTELSPDQRKSVMCFYEAIGALCSRLTGVEAFVPHKHFDPVLSPHFTPQEVDAAEREQVCHHTSILIVVAIAPSWGGGIEVEMAYQNGVPIIILCDADQLEQRRVSRLLRGNPGVRSVIGYHSMEEALVLLQITIESGIPSFHARRAFNGSGVMEVTQQAGLSH